MGSRHASGAYKILHEQLPLPMTRGYEQDIEVVPWILSCGRKSSCRHMPTGAEKNVAFKETSSI